MGFLCFCVINRTAATWCMLYENPFRAVQLGNFFCATITYANLKKFSLGKNFLTWGQGCYVALCGPAEQIDLNNDLMMNISELRRSKEPKSDEIFCIISHLL